MTADNHLAHGIFLLQHKHFREAEQELRQALAQSPENARGHAMLAMALTAQQKNKEALAEARQAVALAPNQAYVHYTLAMALYYADQNQDALAAIYDALRIDPNDVDYYEVLAKIYAAMDKWERALESARKGLAIDPQNVDCANLQANALVHLGRQGEASTVIETALENDPENAVTHANMGWAALHAGKHQEALAHFREALRLNPNLEWARRGIVEAMKARNIIYRPILAYFLWMSRLSGQVRWGLIIGLWVLIRFLRGASRAYPDLNTIILPILGLYIVFALVTWIANPLFNLFLRLDKFGRLALSQEEITASNWLGLCIFGGLGLLAAGALAHLQPLLLAGMGLFAMAIPVSGIFHGTSRKSRTILIIYAVGLAITGALATLLGLQNAPGESSVWTLFVLGWVLYTWAGNFIMKIE